MFGFGKGKAGIDGAPEKSREEKAVDDFIILLTETHGNNQFPEIVEAESADGIEDVFERGASIYDPNMPDNRGEPLAEDTTLKNQVIPRLKITVSDASILESGNDFTERLELFFHDVSGSSMVDHDKTEINLSDKTITFTIR